MVFEPGEDLFALCCEEETGVNGDEVHIGSPVVSRCPRKRGITKNPDESFLGIGVLGAKEVPFAFPYAFLVVKTSVGGNHPEGDAVFLSGVYHIGEGNVGLATEEECSPRR